MKIMQALVLTLFSFLLQSNVFGISIVYNGFECLNAIDTNDPTPKGTPVQSKFEVIQDAGDGLYRLSLTGGIPRFINNNRDVCIDNATAIGYSGIPSVDGLPQPLESINATAYFNGQELMIVVSSLYTDLSARRNPFSSFNTSIIFAFTNTLIFEFNPRASSFSLKKVIRNRGFTNTSGSTNSITPFFETILPSFNDEVQDKPKILTPIANIEFLLD
ncbi:hypothetical protein [Nitrosomonas sp.]|uniref:hypothetical protein n=1 Tax=Nitrosomonas sp. TaxID=42353 RepID=UPI0025FCC2AD|nr:hypothetical protein [Nitrosomonas sp.]